MIKLLEILNEIGEASRAFKTQRTEQGQYILYTINDYTAEVSN
jgi:hypothetical protein